MKVQVYNDGPARVFVTREHTMVCELNANTREETSVAMKKLGYQRISRWTQTDWGWEARFSIHPEPVKWQRSAAAVA